MFGIRIGFQFMYRVPVVPYYFGICYRPFSLNTAPSSSLGDWRWLPDCLLRPNLSSSWRLLQVICCSSFCCLFSSAPKLINLSPQQPLPARSVPCWSRDDVHVDQWLRPGLWERKTKSGSLTLHPCCRPRPAWSVRPSSSVTGSWSGFLSSSWAILINIEIWNNVTWPHSWKTGVRVTVTWTARAGESVPPRTKEDCSVMLTG